MLGALGGGREEAEGGVEGAKIGGIRGVERAKGGVEGTRKGRVLSKAEKQSGGHVSDAGTIDRGQTSLCLGCLRRGCFKASFCLNLCLKNVN